MPKRSGSTPELRATAGKSTFLIAGLPASGKTSYIAAFWYVVGQGRVPSALQLTGLAGDREHLNKLAKFWADGREVPRTAVGTEPRVSMMVKDAARGVDFELVFPDLSGEHFRDAWIDRAWSAEIDELVKSAAGLLLFIHPEQIKEPTRLDAVARLAQAAQDGEMRAPLSAEGDSDSVEYQEWESSESPTDVILVDLLQAITARRHGSALHDRSPRIAVVVSAWDLVRNYATTPEDLLERRLPLLAQYLASLSGSFEVRYYGLSAYGGEPSSDREALLAFDEPTDRIEMLGQDCAPHDITSPVRWLAERA